ncbi:hypothetical protein APR04_004067 [Promicromonospora umidemergens]|uniref:EVE domain-containing protein n=1 Tax=Promicromonospora umidemergens TaxID=629679 RepID=A0ABP8XVF1_9MICO|nr:hypothetical protein [Promicromonospora umidemergens]MCP2285139.1 hypothetical protein [Promicromonospora umidemergens]
MASSFLLVISDREALGWILTEGRTAFPSARRLEVAALAKGDELFLYTTRSCFKNPTRDRGRVIGIADVVSPVVRLDEPVRFAGRDFPVGCALQIGPLAPFGHGVELAPLLTSLAAFDHTERAWSMKLRRPMLRLPDGDTQLIRDRLATVATGLEGERYVRWYLPVA